MGNCLTTSPDTDLHTHPTLMDMSATSVSPSHTKALSFTPILPFSTHSTLRFFYALGPELGRGQYGIIRSCTCRSSGTSFACKSISKLRLSSDREIEDVIREVRVMKRLSKADRCSTGSIVRLHDVIEDKAFIHLILELCQGGELYERIVRKNNYSEVHAISLMRSLLETVQFCHGMGIMHRDIKPENILLVENSDTSPIKLADFGLSLEFSAGQKFSGLAGSSYYMAPEVLQGRYSEEIDMWSAGVIMYVLLSGVPPFWGVTEQRIYKAIEKGELSFPSKPWDDISPSAKDLITKMLHPNPKLRITPAQALKHPWILQHQSNDARESQPTAASNGRGATGHGKSAGTLGPYALTVTTASLQEGKNVAFKEDLSKVLVQVIASMDEEDVKEKRLQNGWTCTVLSRNLDEEMMVVYTSQEKILVSHDRLRKKIGWKLLSQRPTSSD